MSDIAICTKNLSKRYRIGLKEEMSETMVGAVTNFFLKPVKNVRRLRRLSKFEENDSDLSDIIWAVKDFSLEVKEGEVVGIVGRNGSGKTTLLKLLSRITEPTYGSAEIHGRVGSLLEVSTGFHSELTGRENIYLNSAILGMKKAEIDRKLDGIIHFSGLEKFIDTPVKRYSSGMIVRLGFSVAAHLEPDILFIDEVLAVGDVSFQKKCLEKMDDVSKGGRTVLFVSHNMEAILGLCSRAIWIDKGKKMSEGPTNRIVREYLSSFENHVMETKLSERADRTGNGDMRFTGFRLQDKKGKPINTVIMGEDIEFVFSYETKGGPVRNVVVWFWVNDGFGRKVVQFYTQMTGEDFDSLPPRGEIICSVPNFRLSPGKYSIDLHALVSRKRADEIIGAAVVDVTSGDFFGTGKIGGVNQGSFLCEHTWRYSEDFSD